MIVTDSKEIVEYFLAQKPAFIHIRDKILDERIPVNVRKSVGFKFWSDQPTPIPLTAPYRIDEGKPEEYRTISQRVGESIESFLRKVSHEKVIVEPKGDINLCTNIVYFDPSLANLNELDRTDMTRGALAYALADVKRKTLGVTSENFIYNTSQAAGLDKQLERFQEHR